MTRASFASLALLLVTALGTTGCYSHRYRVRYGYGPRMRMMYVARPGMPAPPAPPPPPAPPQQPTYTTYSAANGPIVVHANAPGTTIIVINPPPNGQPAVGFATAPPMAAPMAPAPPAPPAAPQAPAQPENPNGWFQDEE